MADPILMHDYKIRLRASADRLGIAISNRRIARRAFFLQRIHQRTSPAEADRTACGLERFWLKHGRDLTEREMASLIGRAVTASFGRVAA